MWKCAKCREEHAEGFDACWSCGTPRASDSVSLGSDATIAAPQRQESVSVAPAPDKRRLGIVGIVLGIVGALILLTQVNTFMGVRYIGTMMNGRMVSDGEYLLYWLIVVALIAGGTTLAVSGRTVLSHLSEGLNSESKRACPHCAEMIQPTAKICRFCQRDVSAVAGE